VQVPVRAAGLGGGGGIGQCPCGGCLEGTLGTPPSAGQLPEVKTKQDIGELSPTTQEESAGGRVGWDGGGFLLISALSGGHPLGIGRCRSYSCLVELGSSLTDLTFPTRHPVNFDLSYPFRGQFPAPLQPSPGGRLL
jgi:hypothetical protein